LTTGQLGWSALLHPPQCDLVQRLFGPLTPFALGHPPHAEPVGHVVQDAHVREQRIVLEDGGQVALERRHRRHVNAAELDPPRVGLLEAAHQTKDGGLPRAGRSQHREELTRCDVEVYTVDRGDSVETLSDCA